MTTKALRSGLIGAGIFTELTCPHNRVALLKLYKKHLFTPTGQAEPAHSPPVSKHSKTCGSSTQQEVRIRKINPVRPTLKRRVRQDKYDQYSTNTLRDFLAQVDASHEGLDRLGLVSLCLQNDYLIDGEWSTSSLAKIAAQL